MDQGDVVVIAEQGHHLLGFVVPQEAGVDEDAGQLITNGLMDQDGGDRGVYTARQATDHPALPHLGADLGNHFLTEGGHGPVATQARDLVGEVAQHLGTARGVSHFRMKLDAVEPSGLVGDHRIGAALRGGSDGEALGDGGDLVPMAHPDGFQIAHLAQALQKGAGALNADLGTAELAGMAALDLAAQLLAQGHFAIANAQNRDAQLEDLGGNRGALILMDAGRAARQDHRLWCEGVEHGLDLVVGMDLAIDPAFAQAPGD